MYIALILATKEEMWLCLLLTKLGFLQSNQQYTLIKVFKNNKNIYAICNNLKFKQKREHKLKSKGKKQLMVILLKDNNQDLIALIHNPGFYLRIKYINIQHHYIRNQVTLKKINLIYVLTNQIIADKLTKTLIYIKFHNFIK